jgi:alkylation response protein AidB-like acyl-CoA dehydrogenase
MGTADDAHDTSIVGVAQSLADSHLFPTAQLIDRCELIPRDRFEPLASAGLFGIGGPDEFGGPGRTDLDPMIMRRTIAAIASGCGATFFVWAQHHGVVRSVRGASNDSLRTELLQRLCTGQLIGGTAFAHLRRSDRRAVTARSVDGGWQLDGRAPWATSWGIADVFTVAAETSDGRVVWALIDRSDQPGLLATPLGLPVFAATGTVSLTFDGLVVPDDHVLDVVEPADRWRRDDRQRAAVGQTGVLGVADRAITLLRASARNDGDLAMTAADRLQTRLADVWARDDDFIATMASAADRLDVEAASDHRAACLELGLHSTAALLAAVGGGGMDLDHPAQRLSREAAFYVIQAQTSDGRNATLRAAGR